MKILKSALLCTILTLGLVGAFGASGTVAGGGYDCEGAGDACNIPITREDGSTVTIKGARGVELEN